MMMMCALVTLIALTSPMSASALADIVTRLPADVPVTDGLAVNSICGSCCQGGAYCGTVPEDVLLAGVTRPASNLLVPMGTNMTCMLRARDVFGAVDGGLCVPSLLPKHFPIETLCRSFDKTLSPSHTLTKVIYQSNLVEQESCGRCCDGYHVCGVSDTCRPTAARDSSVCVPNNATTRDYCGVTVAMNKEVSCESCDEPSPAAEAFEAQFTPEPQFTSSRRHLLTTQWAAAPSSRGFCHNQQQCKTNEVCTSGACHKKPNYCENDQHCKAGYECYNHFCSETLRVSPRSTPQATEHATPAATSDAIKKSTPVNAPTITPAPTAKATVKPTPAPTAKATPVSAAKATPAPTAKATPVSTAKLTPAATAKATPAPTAKPTPAATAKATPAPTAKPTPAATAKATPAPTAKPTPAATAKATPAPPPPPPPPQAQWQTPQLVQGIQQAFQQQLG